MHNNAANISLMKIHIALFFYRDQVILTIFQNKTYVDEII